MKFLSFGAPSYVLLVCIPMPLTLGLTYFYDLWWLLLASIVYSKILAVIGIQIGLHRYFSHRSFITTKAKHIFLCWASLLTGTAIISWAMTHLHHHRHSETDQDLHSPHIDGFLRASVLWPLNTNKWFQSKKIAEPPPRLVRDKHVMFICNNYYLIWAILVIATLLVSWKVCLFVLLFPASFATLNSAIMTNGLAHLSIPGSYRNFDLPDQSTNNKWVQLYQIGEGLHNNHHKYPARYNQATEPGEYDPAAWIVEKFFIENNPKSKYIL